MCPFRSAPELGSFWNPSLRKTLSHPAAVHRQKASKSSGDPSVGSADAESATTSNTKVHKLSTSGLMASKSVKYPKGRKEKKERTSALDSLTSLSAASRKYSCPQGPGDHHPETTGSGGVSSGAVTAPVVKSKKSTFLESFRNPLRQRSKVDTTSSPTPCSPAIVTTSPVVTPGGGVGITHSAGPLASPTALMSSFSLDSTSAANLAANLAVHGAAGVAIGGGTVAGDSKTLPSSSSHRLDPGSSHYGTGRRWSESGRPLSPSALVAAIAGVGGSVSAASSPTSPSRTTSGGGNDT